MSKQGNPDLSSHRGRGRPPVRVSAQAARRTGVLTAAANLVGDMESRYLSVATASRP